MNPFINDLELYNLIYHFLSDRITEPPEKIDKIAQELVKEIINNPERWITYP